MAKTKRKAPTRKTIKAVTVTKLVVPGKWVYEYFTGVIEETKLPAGSNCEFNVAVRDDKVVVAKRGCDETFIFDKSTFKELAEAVE